MRTPRLPRRSRRASACSCPTVVGKLASAAAGRVPRGGTWGEGGGGGGGRTRGGSGGRSVMESSGRGSRWRRPCCHGDVVVCTRAVDAARSSARVVWASLLAPARTAGGRSRNGGITKATINDNVGAIVLVRRRRGDSATQSARHCGLQRIRVRQGAHPAVARSPGSSMESTRVEGGRGKKIRRRQ